MVQDAATVAIAAMFDRWGGTIEVTLQPLECVTPAVLVTDGENVGLILNRRCTLDEWVAGTIDLADAVPIAV